MGKSERGLWSTNDKKWGVVQRICDMFTHVEITACQLITHVEMFLKTTWLLQPATYQTSDSLHTMDGFSKFIHRMLKKKKK